MSDNGQSPSPPQQLQQPATVAITSIAQAVAQQRLAKMKKARMANGDFNLLSAGQEQALLVALGQEPITWCMAIMAYLDQRTLDQAARYAEYDNQIADMEAQLEALEVTMKELRTSHGLI